MTYEDGIKRMSALKLTKEQKVLMYDFMLQLKADGTQKELARKFKAIGLTEKQRSLLIEFLDDLSAEKAEG